MTTARRPAALPAAALAAAALLVLGGAPADAGEGFLLRTPLRVVLGSGEAEAVGGVEARLRVTNARTTVQSFTVWFRGLSDAEGATLWMAKPGEFETEEVADFAVADNGSGIWTVKADSGWETSPDLPLGVEAVTALAGARVEVRLPGDDLEDAPVLSGKLGDFDYGDLPARPGAPGNVVRTFRLRLPPDVDARPDA
ncbi:MAG: hypothetical protein HUU06_13570, partial [Planctomycetaceae bacterium]|nr:hypothetical protein [Planctomycetaceae bacterium]